MFVFLPLRRDRGERRGRPRGPMKWQRKAGVDTPQFRSSPARAGISHAGAPKSGGEPDAGNLSGGQTALRLIQNGSTNTASTSPSFPLSFILFAIPFIPLDDPPNMSQERAAFQAEVAAVEQWWKVCDLFVFRDPYSPIHLSLGCTIRSCKKTLYCCSGRLKKGELAHPICLKRPSKEALGIFN